MVQREFLVALTDTSVDERVTVQPAALSGQSPGDSYNTVRHIQRMRRPNSRRGRALESRMYSLSLPPRVKLLSQPRPIHLPRWRGTTCFSGSMEEGGALRRRGRRMGVVCRV